MALRTGLNFIACNYQDAVGVVTVDADGQHLPVDVIAVSKALQESPNTLVMGCRQFGSEVPLRSRFGNITTRYVMRFLAGINASDTQTGLRGIPRRLIPTLLRLSTSGYDFELDMLIKTHANRISTREVPISTVYIDENRSSHFRPLLDSLAIYFVLIRHMANALVSALVDNIVFAFMWILGFPVLTSLVVGRVLSALFNFFVGKTLVFKSKDNVVRELVEYALLAVCVILLAYGAITFLVAESGMSPMIAKLIVELALFFLSFSVQRVFIFGRGGDASASP
jgi:putative flippase GtrA